MTPAADAPEERMESVIPVPVERRATSEAYAISPATEIEYEDADAKRVAEYLAELLRPATGYELPVVETTSDGSSDAITLSSSGAPSDVGAAGYVLETTEDGVSIDADRPAGLFAGVQTLRQLLPPSIEADSERSGPWTVPGGRIIDYPRFEYRGAHLDVARHFFTVDEVREFVDQVALYKVNHLHLHLTDNEGWRLEIDEWPELTATGARTDIDGESGGYYTKDEYREIVEYAQSRGITVVPELDVPAHTGAAVTAYPELSNDDETRSMPADSGTLDVDADVTYEFVEDVVREVAELTPGPYVHIGGDEADDLSDEEYARFIDRALPIVERHGKTPVGWQEVVGADAPTSTVIQYWKDTDLPLEGYDLVLSPRLHCYLNFRYDEETPADGIDTWGERKFTVEESYDWDPGTHLAVDESSVLGTETALWSEKLETPDQVEFNAFPRLPGVAELGWSPASETDWESYRHRLAAQAPRWEELGIDYYRSPQVPWRTDE